MDMNTIDDVLSNYPDLSYFGFGRRDGCGGRFTDEEFRKLRETLRKSGDMVEAAREWIRRHYLPRKTLNRHAGSYRIKHVIEKDVGYVSNGACIAAMILEGYRVGTPGEDWGPNCCFNVSMRVNRSQN